MKKLFVAFVLPALILLSILPASANCLHSGALETDNYCPQCGEQLAENCEECGSRKRDAGEYCSSCGQRERTKIEMFSTGLGVIGGTIVLFTLIVLFVVDWDEDKTKQVLWRCLIGILGCAIGLSLLVVSFYAYT